MLQFRAALSPIKLFKNLQEKIVLALKQISQSITKVYDLLLLLRLFSLRTIVCLSEKVAGRSSLRFAIVVFWTLCRQCQITTGGTARPRRLIFLTR